MAANPDTLRMEDFFEPASKSPVSTGQPRQATPLVGREGELQEIAQILSDPAYRILTLVGPGGVGKTRLSLHVISESSGKFHDGAFLVPLLSVKSAEFLASALATTLKIPSFGQGDMKTQALNYLREKEMLLVLDNFEHLLEAADWLLKISQEAPKVKFIVTSRESLGIRGEKVYTIRGLQGPVDQHEIDIEKYGAVLLFLHKAREAQPNFQLTEEEKPFLAQLCKFLDGMPLGLELAAAWVKTLSIREIFDEMRRNRDFLVSAYGDLPERHRSLRSAFESSWNMLTAGQQETLLKLAVFSAPFRGEAAEFVTGAGIHHLVLLADKSILRKNSVGRFETHSLLKQYIAEKLEEKSAVKEEIRQKHCRYFAAFMKERAPLLLGPQQREALEEIGSEIEDVRLAWAWAVEKGMRAEVEMLAESLFFYYEIHGLYQEGEKLFGSGAQTLWELVQNEGLGAAQTLRALQGDLMARQGNFEYRLGRLEKATELLQSSLAILEKEGSGKQVAFAVNHLCLAMSLIKGNFQEILEMLEKSADACEKEGETSSLALTLKNLGYVHWRLGNYAKARQELHRSQNLFQQTGDAHSLSVVLTEIANLAYDQSRYQEADDLCLECLKIQKKIGDKSGEAWTRGKLGNIHWAMGNFETAKNFYDQSLALFKQTGDPEGIAWAMNSLGQVLRAMGKYPLALKSFREGGGLYQKAGHQWGTAWSLANQGHLECLFANPEEAEKHLLESRRIFGEITHPWGTAYALDGLGQVASRKKQWDEAVKLHQEALELFQVSDNQREIGVALCNLGGVALSLGNLEQAREDLLTALKTTVNLSMLPLVLRILLGLSVLEAREGKAEEALATALFVFHQDATEWESREKAKVFADILKPKFDSAKLLEIEKKAKETNIQQITANYL